MYKLRFSEPSVRTYMDGKITVCKYNCTLYNNLTKKIIVEFPATGTSRCADTDTPNAEYGRKLADSRAKLVAYKTMANFVSREDLETLFKKVSDSLELIEFIDSMRFLKKKEQTHIEFLNAEAENK